MHAIRRAHTEAYFFLCNGVNNRGHEDILLVAPISTYVCYLTMSIACMYTLPTLPSVDRGEANLLGNDFIVAEKLCRCLLRERALCPFDSNACWSDFRETINKG